MHESEIFPSKGLYITYLHMVSMWYDNTKYKKNQNLLILFLHIIFYIYSFAY